MGDSAWLGAVSSPHCAFDVVTPARIEQINRVGIDPELGALFCWEQRQRPGQAAIELLECAAGQRNVQIQDGWHRVWAGNAFQLAAILGRRTEDLPLWIDGDCRLNDGMSL